MRACHVILLLMLLASCRHAQPDFEELLEPGQRASEGSMHTLTYQPVQIEDNAYVQETVQYQETDEGFEGTITLEFTGQGDVTYRHNIPKEFAQSADDIEFSREPDRIINPDPEVEWSIEFDGTKPVGIQLKARGKTDSVELFDAFDKQKNFEICRKVDKATRDMCLMMAVGNLRAPKPSDCDIITIEETRQSCVAGVAAVREDITICSQIKSADIMNLCFTTFALAGNDRSVCSKIPDRGMRTICELVFEAKEKGVSFDVLYEEKIRQLNGTQEDELVLDIMIDTDDDTYYTGRSYAFVVSLDPPDRAPTGSRYEVKWSDKDSTSGSSRIQRSFDRPGTYTLTAILYNGQTALLQRARSYVIVTDKEKLASDCTDKGASCADDCNRLCEQTKAGYCEKFGYSGCALDVFCWCNACAIYDE